jgi:hypothetical protein
MTAIEDKGGSVTTKIFFAGSQPRLEPIRW